MLSKKVAFNTSTRFIEQAGYKIKWNILCKHYMLYVIYNSSCIFSHAKTFIRTLDKLSSIWLSIKTMRVICIVVWIISNLLNYPPHSAKY